MAPRGPTAYFIFAGEHRAAIHEEIAAQNNGKASVALVGKAIGVKWNQLTDEQKQKYKDLAAEKARELKGKAITRSRYIHIVNHRYLIPHLIVFFGSEQAAAAAGDGEEGEEEAAAGTSGGPPPQPFGFPLSLIKKIATMDPDVDRIAADATKALSKATALFVELLATKAINHATQLKRKNFKFSDIEAVAKRDRRMVDMGLPELFEKDKAFEEVRTKAAEEGQPKRGGRKAAGEGGDGEEQQKKKMRPLTDFFKGGGAGGEGANEVERDEEDEEGAEVEDEGVVEEIEIEEIAEEGEEAVVIEEEEDDDDDDDDEDILDDSD